LYPQKKLIYIKSLASVIFLIYFADRQNFFKLKVAANMIACYQRSFPQRFDDNSLDGIKQCVFDRPVPVLDFIQNNVWLKYADLCEYGFVSLLDYRKQIRYILSKSILTR
jgi:hypothetical protein